MVPRRLPRRGGSPAAVPTQVFPASPAPEGRAGAGAARLVIRARGRDRTNPVLLASRERKDDDDGGDAIICQRVGSLSPVKGGEPFQLMGNAVRQHGPSGRLYPSEQRDLGSASRREQTGKAVGAVKVALGCCMGCTAGCDRC